MTDQFKHGDRVYVTDPYLAQMREIMRNATGEAAPNHHGTVEEVWGSGDILIHFDDGVGAPYPVNQVRHLEEQPEPGSLAYAQQRAEAAGDLDHETEEETR